MWVPFLPTILKKTSYQHFISSNASSIAAVDIVACDAALFMNILVHESSANVFRFPEKHQDSHKLSIES